jgi:ubiquinone/menaquinone biosynthesis C-methylase UbiE
MYLPLPASTPKRGRLDWLMPSLGTILTLVISLGIAIVAYLFIDNALVAQRDDQLKDIIRLLIAISSGSLSWIILIRFALMPLVNRKWMTQQLDSFKGAILSEIHDSNNELSINIDKKLNTSINLAKITFSHPEVATRLGNIAVSYNKLQVNGGDTFFPDIARITIQEWERTMKNLASGKFTVNREATATLDERWKPIFDNPQPGEITIAVSSVHPDWWVHNKDWQSTNSNAVQRGLIILRLFILESEDEINLAKEIMSEQSKMGIQVGVCLSKDVNSYRKNMDPTRDIILHGVEIKNLFSPIYSEKLITSASVIGEQKLTSDRKLWSKIHISKEKEDIKDAIDDVNSYLANSRLFTNTSWTECFFPDEYQCIFGYRHNDVKVEAEGLRKILKNMGVKNDAKMLDLACGDGRMAIEISKSHEQYNIIGLDICDSLLNIARVSTGTSSSIQWTQADMRNISYNDEFDVIFCLDSSFGYFDDNENMKILESVFRALKSQGIFILEIENKRYWEKHHNLNYSYNSSIDSQIKLYRSDSYGQQENSLITQFVIRNENGAKFKPAMVTKLYSSDDLKAIFQRLGFIDFKLYRNYNLDPYLNEQSRRIILAVRKG